MNVKFKSLDTTANRGVLAIDYKISKKSWQQIANARMAPRINLYLSNPRRTKYIYVYSLPLNRRKGRLVYPRFNLQNHTTAAFEVVGYSGQYRIQTSSLGRQRNKLITTKIYRAAQPPTQQPPNTRPPQVQPPTQNRPPAGNWRAEAITACKKQKRFTSGFNKCVAAATKLNATDAAAVVTSCGKASSNDNGLVNCIETAKFLFGRRTDTIAACGTATRFDSELAKCLTQAKSYRFTAANIVRSCKKQSRFDSGFIKCFKTATVLPNFNAAAVVTVCGNATKNDNGLASCIQMAPGLGRGRIGVIEACGKSSRFDSDLLKCLKQAGGR